MNLVQTARDAIPSLYASAAEDGLGVFVLFWNIGARDIQYSSLEEFATQRSKFAEINVVQEGSIIKKNDYGFVEYILLSNRTEVTNPHHLALAMSSTVIKREHCYVVCYPDSYITAAQKAELEEKFREQEDLLSDAQREVEEMLEDVDVCFFLE